jgi:triacylglycerol lipase
MMRAPPVHQRRVHQETLSAAGDEHNVRPPERSLSKSHVGGIALARDSRPMERAGRWAWTLPAAAIAAYVYATRRYFRISPGPTEPVHEDLRTAWTPMWRELLTPAQWLRLRCAAIYRGDGVPRGDGSPVLLVHGFLTWGLYLGTMRAWLERLGYHARIAHIGLNADCYDVLADRLRAETERFAGPPRRRVHLVGHSLGGVLVRAVAAHVPELVASVTYLATPLRGLRVHPGLRLSNLAVRSAVRRRRDHSVFPECMTFGCQCAAVRALTTPLPSRVPQLAVVARGDGLADWRYEMDPETSRVLEVRSSHFGVVFEPAVYEALARHLTAAGDHAAVERGA